MNNNLIDYYNKRAHEYEKIYHKAERQPDLRKAAEIIQEAVGGKKVFEIGCGTGYWTERIAATASSVFATDINESVLEIARAKAFPLKNAGFGLADMYQYQSPIQYDCLFAGFTWSHVKVQDMDAFLKRAGSFVLPGGSLIFIDNNYVEGSSTPVSTSDGQGNTYQQRKLEDGSEYQVIKNFPGEQFVKAQITHLAGKISFNCLEYFWILQYTTLT